MDLVSHLVINPTPGLSKPFLLTKSLLPSQDDQGDTCDCKQALGRGGGCSGGDRVWARGCHTQISLHKGPGTAAKGKHWEASPFLPLFPNTLCPHHRQRESLHRAGMPGPSTLRTVLSQAELLGATAPWHPPFSPPQNTARVSGMIHILDQVSEGPTSMEASFRKPASWGEGKPEGL